MTMRSVHSHQRGTSCRLDIVVSTYEQPFWIDTLLSSLAVQSRNDFRVVIVHDGPSTASRKRVNLLRRWTGLDILYAETPVRHHDWGHSPRAFALATIVSSPLVLFTNADNYYVPIFVETALPPFDDPDVGVVFFDMLHSHAREENVPPGPYGYFRTRFESCQCDLGAFVTRTDIARAVGFNHRHNEADAAFIEEVKAYRQHRPFAIEKIDRVLFVHN
ncbi:MAG: glycosyltransferase [Acidobacteriota bacterium]